MTSERLRANEIRPDALMAEQAERLARDLEWLLERREDFVPVACPACGGDGAVPELEKGTLAYVTCVRCRTMYMNPRPTPELLEEYHRRSENYAYWSDVIFPASEQRRREGVFAPRARRIAELCAAHAVRGGPLVDVGAGFGTFCEEIAALGVCERVVAVEPTPTLAEACRTRGLEVIEEPVERVELPPASVSVVTAFEVIEHLFDPRVLVERCASLLEPGGLLVLTCPNVQGFDVLTLRERSSAVDHEHLNYFNPESLAALAARCGLDVVETSTPGRLDAELVHDAAVSGHVELTGFLRLVLLDRWDELADPFQRFLAEHRLSSHLWVVAQRPRS